MANTYMKHEQHSPPGASLRDPQYQDICGFFATSPEGKKWEPQFGDWVVIAPDTTPALIIQVEDASDRLLIAHPTSAEPVWHTRASCVWLPTLDQLRTLLKEHFGTVGCFTSTFKDSTYWYTGQMLGMTVTNMEPLAEGSTPEEAAIKALLMRHQW